MKGRRYAEEQIVRILGEVQGGRSVPGTAHQHRVSEGTIHRRRKQVGDMELSEVKRLRPLAAEGRWSMLCIAFPIAPGGHVRRIACALAALAIILALSAAAASAQELVTNPELLPTVDGAAPESWIFEEWDTGSSSRYSATGGRGGSPAAGIEVPSDQDRGSWYQRVPLGGRRRLHLTGCYRTEGISPHNAAAVRLTWLDAEREFLRNDRIELDAADDWTTFERVVSAPADAAILQVELFDFFRPGIVWWDSAHLREATREELLHFDDRPGGVGEWGFRPRAGEVCAVTPPAFVWRPQQGAVSYAVQVARDEQFADLAWGAAGIDLTAHVPPRTIEPGRYWWRVRFIDGEGSQSSWSLARGFTIPENAAAFPLPTRADLCARVPEGHPRLFLRPEELPRLRELARGPLKDRYDELVRRCEELIARPPNTADYPKYPEGMERLSPEWARIWRGARSYVERPLVGAATLGFIWRLGGPERYGEMARRLLMEVAEWDPVGATGYRYNDEAGMRYAWGFSRAYTMVADLLTDEEREKCRQVMRVRGTEMYAHLHRYRHHLWKPYSSHPNRAYHFLGEIGLAFHGEIPEAEDWAWFTTNVFFSVYPVWSDDDGGWHEGTSYWSSYIYWITEWLDIMQATLKLDGYGKPFFSQVGYYPIYAQPPNLPRIVFGDTTGVRVAPNLAPIMSVFAQTSGNPYWCDYVERIGGPVDSGGYRAFLHAARALERGETPRRSIAELPTSRLFRGTGLAFMHTDLTDAANDVMVAFKSSPFGSQSHGNEAQNSFELYAFGEPLLVRSGTREIHGSPHHRGWTQTTRSCNAITANGVGQMPNSASAVGRIRDFAAAPDCAWMVGDAAEAYATPMRRADRHMLFVKPDLLLVVDDLQTAEPATFEYWLHTVQPLQVQAPDDIALVVGGAGCRISFLAPDALRLTQSEGYDPPIRPPYDEQIHEYHLTAQIAEPSALRQFVTLIRPHRADQPIDPRAEYLALPAGHALRAPVPEGEALILLRTGSGRLAAWGLETDADVAVVRVDDGGQVGSCFVAGAGDVSWQGVPLAAQAAP